MEVALFCLRNLIQTVNSENLQDHSRYPEFVLLKEEFDCAVKVLNASAEDIQDRGGAISTPTKNNLGISLPPCTSYVYPCIDASGFELIKGHRLSLGKGLILPTVNSIAFMRELLHGTKKGRYMQRNLMPTEEMSSLAGLKPITLDEMDRDIKYIDRYLHLINIEPARSYEFETSYSDNIYPVSIALVGEDEKKRVSRVFVYNYVWAKVKDVPDDTDHQFGLTHLFTRHEKLNDKLPQGCHLYVLDPQIKMAADNIPTLVVRDRFFAEPKKDSDEARCARCGISSGGMSRCSKCKETSYCSRECQLSDWCDNEGGHKPVCRRHKLAKDGLEEDSERPPWSVYRLRHWVYEDLVPPFEERAVRTDYGFNNCPPWSPTNQGYGCFSLEEGKLLGLYQGLIKYLDADLVKLHHACINGRLAEFIIENFEDSNARGMSKGEYYPWFLKRQHLVKNIYSRR